ncbi:hypothetical protein PCC8801_3938 [Rippkaea orientalis PCC 8801]|uniref:Antitoxin FitA-like ribbon-helix-helix domain-containing protein n=1 Tax=Rippkaea orientalis (strain PCC 8801 / RF-1) TaxID=41431 RepID=B7K556_RIPO1|nr:hypothetical protein [Rippkaea orientalis]ACK67882.1 hypothetical protein PCC8801_3938 [Rippkaea orientalis PCC 8801]
MTIILDNLEPEILEKLQTQAISHGRSLTEEIKVILTKELVKENQDNLEEDMSQLEWHEFIEKTYGCLADDPIERYPQGEYPIREELE